MLKVKFTKTGVFVKIASKTQKLKPNFDHLVVQHYPITFAVVSISWSKSDQSPTADRFKSAILKLLIMKLYGIGGVGTGKLGNQVFAVKGGVQVVRQYQPVVTNPNTPAQVETRAKMKLISQVAAVVAPTIAIPAEGLKTKRNMFISRNYNLMDYADNKATISLNSMQLTKGTLAFGDLALERSGVNLSANIIHSISSDITKIVYILLQQTANGKLLLAESQTKDYDNGQGLICEFNKAAVTGDVYVALAYGIRPNTERAKSYLDNMQAPTAAAIAQVIAERRLLDSDITMTETIGAVQEVQGN